MILKESAVRNIKNVSCFNFVIATYIREPFESSLLEGIQRTSMLDGAHALPRIFLFTCSKIYIEQAKIS